MKALLKFLFRVCFLAVFFSGVVAGAYWYKLSPQQQLALKRDVTIAWQKKQWPERLSVLTPQTQTDAEVLENPDQPLKSDQQSFENHQVACFKTATKAIKQAEKSSIYTWVDENGKKHFSDNKPKEHVHAQDISNRYKSRLDYFELDINDEKAKSSGFIRDKISSDVTQIYNILARDLDIKNLRQVSLNLRLFGHQSDFQRYKNSLAPGLNTNSGFYTSQLNEAVVYQWPQRDDFTQSVIRHESSHVIMAGLFGETPRWFNEGLAEYFERLDIAGQKKQVKVAEENIQLLLNLLESKRLPPLTAVFDLTARQFYSPNTVSQNYAASWAAVFFLLSQDKTKRLFNAITDQLNAEPCSYIDMKKIADKNYSGGMQALEKDFRYWLTSRDIYDHYY